MPSRKLISTLLTESGQAIPKLEQPMVIETGTGVLTGKVIEAQWKPTGITMVVGSEPTWQVKNEGTDNECEVEHYPTTYRFFYQVTRKDNVISGEWKLSSKSFWKTTYEGGWTRDDLFCFGDDRKDFKLKFDKTLQSWLMEAPE
jgi:hypothetical protein